MNTLIITLKGGDRIEYKTYAEDIDTAHKIFSSIASQAGLTLHLNIVNEKLLDEFETIEEKAFPA